MTKYPYVQRFQNRGIVFHYFRKRRLPQVRLRGEPGSPEFMDVYERARDAQTAKDLLALRHEVNMPSRKYSSNESGDAIMAWAEGKRLTERQIAICMMVLRTTREEILFFNERGRKLARKKKRGHK